MVYCHPHLHLTTYHTTKVIFRIKNTCVKNNQDQTLKPCASQLFVVWFNCTYHHYTMWTTDNKPSLLTLQMKGQRATSCGGCPLACTVQRLVQSGMEWGVSSGWLEKPMMWGRLWSVMWKCPQCQHLNAKIRKSKGKGHNSRSTDRSTCTIVLKLYVIYRNVCFWLNPSLFWKIMQFFFFQGAMTV